VSRNLLVVFAVGLTFGAANVATRYILKATDANWQSVNLLSELTTISVIIVYAARTFSSGTQFTFQPLAALPGILVALSSITMFYSLRQLPAGVVVPVSQAVQLVAVGGLGMFVGDIPSGRQIAGTLLVIIGILLNIR
jgi:drug/metabolite transporter (DMT)-like permease